MSQRLLRLDVYKRKRAMDNIIQFYVTNIRTWLVTQDHLRHAGGAVARHPGGWLLDMLGVMLQLRDSAFTFP
jgi:hypothetical protein